MRRLSFVLSLTISTLPILVACTPEAPKDQPEIIDTGEENIDTGEENIDTGEENIDTGEENIDTGSDTGLEEPELDVASPEEFQALVENARAELTQTFSFDASQYAQLEGEQGTQVYISSNSLLYADGTHVEGQVTYELIELYSKGDMLVADMPSTGRLPNGDIAQLISGGEHFVNATQNGENLTLGVPLYLRAPAENTGGSDSEMTLFRPEQAEADQTADGFADGAWVEEEVTGEEFGIDKEGRQGDGAPVSETYWLLSGQFGWTNIDRWHSDPRPKTEIHVDVPEGWDDTNSAVYISYDGEPTALAQFDTYDDTTELFSEHYGRIPVGLEVHIIFVTETDGQWTYAISGETIQEDHLTVFDAPENFINTDLDGLTSAINALP